MVPPQGKENCFLHWQWIQVTYLPAGAYLDVYCVIVFNVIRCKEQADRSSVDSDTTQKKQVWWRDSVQKRTVSKASKLAPC